MKMHYLRSVCGKTRTVGMRNESVGAMCVVQEKHIAMVWTSLKDEWLQIDRKDA